ncbi:MAG: hypothetical protein JKY13_00365, partial [Gammaproteobacteria bacterium]|nr:hypothetical protein [Gammaproteobacteria bacterium]
MSNKKTRAQLKAHFRQGNTVTEAALNTLFDSMINSEDDGIENPVNMGEPLRIMVDQDNNPQQNVLDFYENATDLAWRIQQNPLIPASSPANYNAGMAFVNNEQVKFFIESSDGNIGINTVTPQAKLHINNQDAVHSLQVGDDDLILTADAKLGIGTEPVNQLDVNGNVAIGSAYAGFSAISANPAPQNGLLVEGYVGMGTDNPQSQLAVAGGVAIGSNYTTTVAPTDGLLIEGQVGIGIQVPLAKLHVQQTDTQRDALRIDDALNDSTPFIIKADGKVG